MLWERWIRYLATALDLDEIDRYWKWVGAQQDPRKFKWSSSDHAGTRLSSATMDHIIREAAPHIGIPKKGDIWEYGIATGKPMAFKGKKFTSDGRFLGYVYVNSEGEEVDTSGYVFIPSSRAEAWDAAKNVFKAESLN